MFHTVAEQSRGTLSCSSLETRVVRGHYTSNMTKEINITSSGQGGSETSFSIFFLDDSLNWRQSRVPVKRVSLASDNVVKFIYD